jgi:hypothetical protein
MQDGIYYSGGSMPGVVQVNEMANCKYGIHLSHGAVIGNQGWQAGLPPHNYDNPNDNLWIQPLSGGYDLFTSDATDGTQSKFYNNTGTPYSNPTSSAQNPPNSIPIPIDFTNGASSIACATSLPVSNLNKEFLENIIKDMVYFAQFQDENTIIGQDNVYIDLRKVDTNNLSQVMKDFIDICQQSDFAKIEEVNRLIREGKMLEADSINNLINENDRSINATRQINSLLINASVDTVNLEYTFKDDELHLLREIASLCPYEYGRAVSLARSILFTIDTNVYFNDCEAESFVVEQRSLKTDNDTSSNIIIYPNPVKNQLFIDQETNVKLHVEIFNVLGVRVYSNDLFDMHNIVQLDNMNAGIYYVKLSQNGEVVKEKKLTIIK